MAPRPIFNWHVPFFRCILCGSKDAAINNESYMNLTYFYLPALFLIHVEMKDILTPNRVNSPNFYDYTAIWTHLGHVCIFVCPMCSRHYCALNKSIGPEISFQALMPCSTSL